MTILCCCMFNIKTLLMFSDLKGLLRFCTKTELLAAFLLGVLSRKEGAKSLGYLACLQLKLCPVSRHSILVGTICFLKDCQVSISLTCFCYLNQVFSSFKTLKQTKNIKNKCTYSIEAYHQPLD